MIQQSGLDDEAHKIRILKQGFQKILGLLRYEDATMGAVGRTWD